MARHPASRGVALMMALALGALGCSNNDPQSSADADAAAGDSAPCDPTTDPRCQGAAMPEFELNDFQPKSTRFGTSYGLSVFKGKVTIVALLAGW